MYREYQMILNKTCTLQIPTCNTSAFQASEMKTNWTMEVKKHEQR